MHINNTDFHIAINNISQQLTSLSAIAEPTIIQLFSPIKSLSALAWLNQQQQFPKLYWQNRSAESEAATIGKILEYWLHDDLPFSQPILAKLPWRFYGGHGFTVGDPQVTAMGGNRFYLPRFEYRREREQSWFICNLLLEPAEQVQQIAAAKQELSQLTALQFATKEVQIKQRQHAPEYNLWAKLVRQITENCQQEKLSKVVLARTTKLTCQQVSNLWQLLAAWQHQQSNCYHFAIQTSAEQGFFGCSPERLFCRRQQELETEALAGTSDHAAKLASLDSAKNQHENQLVVQDVLQQLTPLSEQITTETKPRIIKLQYINHLCCSIKARLKPNISDAKLLAALHPTAAICGLPRAAAQQFIRQYEPIERGWYAGVFGVMGEDFSEFCVTLRSVMQQGCQLNLYAGAGIVIGSEPAEEWQELNSKLASANNIINPSENYDEHLF